MSRKTPAARILALAPVLAPVLVLGLSLAGCKKDAAPPEATASAEPAEDVTAPATMTVEDWIRANHKDALSTDLGKLQYAAAETDLDGDGTPEVLVYLGGPMFCGTGGCNLVVLKREGADLRKVSETSVVQLPVGVLESKSHGWRDLAVTVSGGGMAEGVSRLRFTGKSYPTNASVEVSADAEPVSKPLIAEGALKPLD
ncbi:MAG: hypothetical protein E2586_09520 [Novosphingobium sp.]|uniref:hypothetical protein n=1 Tax=Novosphingobium sp. TaxID=1874826 RepID=UPI0012D05C7B|nr:hypothetical protein [Novosphingobium sp.]MPS68723.1 hypothetical protein [Novosphingobium sp.]